MKNLALFGLAAATAVLAEGSLWNMTVPAYQVQVPETVSCDKTGADYGKACYESTGGWWFAYQGDTEKGQSASFAPIDYNDDGTFKMITTDAEGGIIPGGNLQEGVGLVVTMSAAGGAQTDPAIAGVGWNWTKAETAIDISAHPGLCFAYAWTGSAPLQVELGMPKDVEKATQYDTWYGTLAPSNTSTVKDLPFDATGFKQDAYNDGRKDLTFAITNAVSVKVRIKNAAAAEVKGTLTINEVGWKGECAPGSSGTPSTGIHAVAASSAKATLSGRTLSFSGINSAATYEIVSLQGQVVKSGVVSSSVSLSSLNAGVYMVRVAGKSVNMNQKILVK